MTVKLFSVHRVHAKPTKKIGTRYFHILLQTDHEQFPFVLKLCESIIIADNLKGPWWSHNQSLLEEKSLI